MDKTLQKALLLLGLNAKEVKFYETCFRLGPSTINEIAKEAKIQRSTSYLIAQELLDKGFLEEDLRGYKKKLYAVDPKRILQMVGNKQRLFRRYEVELTEDLPELQATYNLSETRPKVKVYEGNQGLLRVWKDILSTNGEILLWTNQQTDNLVFGKERHISFIEERIRKGIYARVLAVDNTEGRQLQALDRSNNRQTKVLPKKTNFSAETYIYDNKVAILDYNKDIIGVIIESAPISSSNKATFEMVWDMLNS